MGTKYLSCADTAKLVRKALKAAFPGVKFSVRSKTYSGGASIDINYTDGPTQSEVNAVVDQFQGADFDGMQDLKNYRGDTLLDGEMVSFGADFIFANRRYSPEFTRLVGEAYAAETGWTMPSINPKWGQFERDYTQPVPGGRDPVADWFNRRLWATSEGSLQKPEPKAEQAKPASYAFGGMVVPV